MSDELKWLPAAWMDEYVPETQADPNTFICQSPDHGWLLRPVEDQDADLDDGCIIHISEGQTVKFQANEVYGDFTLTVFDDGTFETDSDIPGKANCFRLDHDTDTLQPNLGELVSCGYGIAGSLEPGTYGIDAYWWSDEEYLFRFDIVDGKGQLTKVGTVQ